jgi:hypothetical protein
MLRLVVQQLPVTVRGHDININNDELAGDRHSYGRLLTQETDADGNNHISYANRSVVEARNFEWVNALQDAVKVGHFAYHDAVDDRLTQMCRIFNCHPTLVMIGLHFQGHCPLRQPAVLQRNECF